MLERTGGRAPGESVAPAGSRGRPPLFIHRLDVDGNCIARHLAARAGRRHSAAYHATGNDVHAVMPWRIEAIYRVKRQRDGFGLPTWRDVTIA